MCEFLMKLSNKSVKHFIIHAPDPSLIKMKQGREFMIAASPRNRSGSSLSPGPDRCVHSSALLLGPDEGCLRGAIFLLAGLMRDGFDQVVSPQRWH